MPIKPSHGNGDDPVQWKGLSWLLSRLTLTPILLLVCSNVFMTTAWYWHLKFGEQTLVDGDRRQLGHRAVRILPGCFPANRWGAKVYSAAELKAIQEVVTLAVFALFAITYLGEKLTLNHAVGFAFIALGAFFIFKGPIHLG